MKHHYLKKKIFTINYHMDTDSFTAYIKTYDIYKDIVEDVETKFDTSNYELDRLLSRGKQKK